MKRPNLTVCLFLLMLYALPCQSIALPATDDKKLKDQESVVFWYRNYDTDGTYDLLKIALDNTRDLYGATELIRSPALTQGRAIASLSNATTSELQLINVIIDEHREKSLRPIKIATDGGLIGFRVCIIKKGEQQRFNNVRSLHDIKTHHIIFGQGSHWPDTEILKANGLPVVTSARYENLYPMLKLNRFNCFLRGANEILEDMKRHGDEELQIEENLLFTYPSASIFFVNKNDTALAARIELGLRRAMLNGDFNKHFQQHYAHSIKELNLKKRRIIRLNNPLLSDETLSNTAENLNLGNGKLKIY